MGQSWLDLLFAHWPVEAAVLRRLVPSPMVVEEHDGSAWLGLTPFLLTALRLRGLPPLPVGSHFLELNCRTYVRVADRPGIYFFSLDAASPVAVLAARVGFRLPYRWSAMARSVAPDGWIDYRCRRRRDGAELCARYRAAGSPRPAAPGSLEHFLVERYSLYAPLGRGRALRADIAHPPWLIAPAEAEVRVQTIAAAAGIALGGAPSLLHFAARQDTRIHRPFVVVGG